MSWNHRIVLERYEFAGEVDETYSLREVYYHEDGSIRAWTQEPIGAVGDDWMGCVDTLARMQRAAIMPVIDVRSGKPVEVKPGRKKAN